MDGGVGGKGEKGARRVDEGATGGVGWGGGAGDRCWAEGQKREGCSSAAVVTGVGRRVAQIEVVVRETLNWAHTVPPNPLHLQTVKSKIYRQTRAAHAMQPKHAAENLRPPCASEQAAST